MREFFKQYPTTEARAVLLQLTAAECDDLDWRLQAEGVAVQPVVEAAGVDDALVTGLPLRVVDGEVAAEEGNDSGSVTVPASVVEAAPALTRAELAARADFLELQAQLVGVIGCPATLCDAPAGGAAGGALCVVPPAALPEVLVHPDTGVCLLPPDIPPPPPPTTCATLLRAVLFEFATRGVPPGAVDEPAAGAAAALFEGGDTDVAEVEAGVHAALDAAAATSMRSDGAATAASGVGDVATAAAVRLAAAARRGRARVDPLRRLASPRVMASVLAEDGGEEVYDDTDVLTVTCGVAATVPRLAAVAAGMAPSPLDVAAVFDWLDVDGDGVISARDWAACMALPPPQPGGVAIDDGTSLIHVSRRAQALLGALWPVARLAAVLTPLPCQRLAPQPAFPSLGITPGAVPVTPLGVRGCRCGACDVDEHTLAALARAVAEQEAAASALLLERQRDSWSHVWQGLGLEPREVDRLLTVAPPPPPPLVIALPSLALAVPPPPRPIAAALATLLLHFPAADRWAPWHDMRAALPSAGATARGVPFAAFVAWMIGVAEGDAASEAAGGSEIGVNASGDCDWFGVHGVLGVGAELSADGIPPLGTCLAAPLPLAAPLVPGTQVWATGSGLTATAGWDAALRLRAASGTLADWACARRLDGTGALLYVSASTGAVVAGGKPSELLSAEANVRAAMVARASAEAREAELAFRRALRALKRRNALLQRVLAYLLAPMPPAALPPTPHGDTPPPIGYLEPPTTSVVGRSPDEAVGFDSTMPTDLPVGAVGDAPLVLPNTAADDAAAVRAVRALDGMRRASCPALRPRQRPALPPRRHSCAGSIVFTVLVRSDASTGAAALPPPATYDGSRVIVWAVPPPEDAAAAVGALRGPHPTLLDAPPWRPRHSEDTAATATAAGATGLQPGAPVAAAVADEPRYGAATGELHTDWESGRCAAVPLEARWHRGTASQQADETVLASFVLHDMPAGALLDGLAGALEPSASAVGGGANGTRLSLTKEATAAMVADATFTPAALGALSQVYAPAGVLESSTVPALPEPEEVTQYLFLSAPELAIGATDPLPRTMFGHLVDAAAGGIGGDDGDDDDVEDDDGAPVVGGEVLRREGERSRRGGAGLVLPETVALLEACLLAAHTGTAAPNAAAFAAAAAAAEDWGVGTAVSPAATMGATTGGGGGGGNSDTVVAGGRVEAALRAARTGHVDELDGLLLSGSIELDDCRDRWGNTLLMVACQNNQLRVARLLVGRGADLNARNSTGNTALHFAFAYRFRPLSDMLLAAGANDTLLNAAGLTPYEGLSADALD